MLVTVGEVEFGECPARFVDAVADDVVDLALADALGGLTPFQRGAMPSGLVEAVEFVRSLLPQKESDDVG